MSNTIRYPVPRFNAGRSRPRIIFVGAAAGIQGRTPTVAETASGTSITGTLPTDRLTGDYVIAQFSMSCTVAQFTGPGGSWTQIVAPTANGAASGEIVAVYGQFSPASAPVGTSSAVAGRQTCIMQAYGGVDTSTPIDVSAVTVSATLPVTITSITTVTNGARLVGGVTADFSTGTWTIPGTMTLVANHTSGTGRGAVMADEVRPTLGATGTRQFTASTLQASVGYLFALRPATGGGPATVTGTAALSGESNLTAVGSNTVFASAALSAESNMATVATPVVLATSALSAQSNLTAVGSIVLNGIVALSGQSSLTAVPSVTVTGITALSGQSSLAAVAGNATFATSALTIQSSLTPLAKLTISGIAALSSQSTLTAVPSLTVKALSALSADLNLITVGTVVGQNPGAALSGQSTLAVVATVSTTGIAALSVQSSLNAIPSVTVLAVSPLSIQSTMTTVPTLIVPGIVALSAQSNLLAVGTRVVLGISALSGQSTLTAVGSNTVIALAPLSGQSTLTVLGKADVKAQSALSANVNLTSTAILTIRGFSVLSGQSTMVVTGGTFNTITGTVTLTLQSGLIVVANTSPPWAWQLIEADSDTVLIKESTSDASGWDGSSDVSTGMEGFVIVTGWEGK